MAEPKNPYVWKNGEWVDTRAPGEKTKENPISDVPENPKKPLPTGGKVDDPKKPVDPVKPTKPVDRGPISDVPENPTKPLPEGGKPNDPVKPPIPTPSPRMPRTGLVKLPSGFARSSTRPTPPKDSGPISDIPERPDPKDPGPIISDVPVKPTDPKSPKPWGNKGGDWIDTRVPGENGNEKPVDPKNPVDPKKPVDPKTPVTPPKDKDAGPISDIPVRPQPKPSYDTPRPTIPGVDDLYTPPKTPVTNPVTPKSPDPVKSPVTPPKPPVLQNPISDVPVTPKSPAVQSPVTPKDPVKGAPTDPVKNVATQTQQAFAAPAVQPQTQKTAAPVAPVAPAIQQKAQVSDPLKNPRLEEGGGPIIIDPKNPKNPITPVINPPPEKGPISPTPETPGKPGPGTPTPTPTPGGGSAQIVPGTPQNANQMNVTDFAGQVVADPNKFFNLDDPKTAQNESMKLADHNKEWNMTGTEAGTNINKNDPAYKPQGPVSTDFASGEAFGSEQVDPRDATGYDAQTTQQNVAQNGQMQGAQGTLSQGSKITAPQLDMKGSATGVNADGSTNYTGKALNDYAKQNISNIIDTSTPSGKALAQQLGDGNYTDSKATLQGQLQALQSQFQGPNGEPKIPAWAAATARNVSKIAAFKGMTGTAATAAMSQALMEASIPIAQQDAQFFQTLTLKNLDNKQQSIINKANVLSKFDLTNMDARMTAAVENSKAFLQMDMANLDNKQQAQVLNQQARVQSILEDAKAVNAQRLFNADSQNDMDKFYENLNTSIAQFNATQTNAMTQSNVEQANKMAMFDQDLNNQRDQFYKNMQYNIDVSNAKWRQSVTLENSQKGFDAAATDVKNMVGIGSEQLNQIWDRSDSLLDYLWQSSEKAADRNALLVVEKLKADLAIDAEDRKGMGSIIGTLIGGVVPKLTDWLFG